MILEGDLSVIDAIKEKKYLLDRGSSHAHIRPLLFIAGGLMRGVYGGGAVIALYDTGYSEVFDQVIGISTGAATAAYFLGGNPKLGTSLYYNECISGEFLRIFKLKNWLFKPFKTIGNPMDIAYIAKVFAGSTGKGINTEAIFKNRSSLYVTVTKSMDASPWYIHTYDKERLLTAVVASCNIPSLNTSNYYIDGFEVIDGTVTTSFPVDFINTLEPKPTHILVLANQPKTQKTVRARFVNQIITNILLRNKFSKKVRQDFGQSYKRFLEGVASIKAKDINILIDYTDPKIKALTINSRKLEAAAEQKRLEWNELLKN